MTENTFPPTEESILHTSFTSYIRKKYSFHNLFLPKHKPANDQVSAEELRELDKMIESRDHFEIRREIAKRYYDEN